jgi:hypothetical protein
MGAPPIPATPVSPPTSSPAVPSACVFPAPYPILRSNISPFNCFRHLPPTLTTDC